MKSLFSQLKTDNQFKKIYIGYNILAAVIVLVASLTPLLLTLPNNVVLGLIGCVLSLGLSIWAALYVSKMVNNKVLGYFFPTVDITLKEVFFKSLAGIILGLLISVIGILLVIIVGMINSIVLYIILIPVIIIGYYQLIVFMHCFYYIVIDCYVNNKLGFKVVLASLRKSYTSMRKLVSKLTIRIIGFTLLTSIVIGIFILIIGGVSLIPYGFMFSLGSGSIFTNVRFLVAQIASIVPLLWISATILQYIIQNYSSVKKNIK